MVHISIRDLTKRFGSQTVLDHIHLEIPQGELFFLLGPSGCGKTTLLRHIAGFYQPDSGQIFFGGDEVTHLPAHQRGTGMMFQSYALWPHLTVTQNIAFGLEEQKRPRAEIEQRVTDALDLVKLQGLGSRRISQLSGGQQQRVALARALIVRPRCLLLDEPLSNLDAKLRHEMRSEIRRICKQGGLTAVYVTHDRDEALSMADRVAIMDSGRIVQLGQPEEIYRHPSNRMVAEFIGESNFITGTLQQKGPGGIWEVRTDFGHLQARPHSTTDWQPESGENVLLAIRPEALSFSDSPDSLNHFPGQIIDMTYLGATVQYLIQIQPGIEMKVCETHPRQLRQPSPEVLHLTAMPTDVVMLKKE